MCSVLMGFSLARMPVAPGQVAATAVDMQRSEKVQQRIPQQQVSTVAALQGIVMDQAGRPLVGVEVRLIGRDAAVQSLSALTSGDGIFRLLRVPPGTYQLTLTPKGGAAVRRPEVVLHAGEVLSIEVHFPVAEKGKVSVLGQMPADVLGDRDYTELSRRPDADGTIVAPPLENISAGFGLLSAPPRPLEHGDAELPPLQPGR